MITFGMAHNVFRTFRLQRFLSVPYRCLRQLFEEGDNGLLRETGIGKNSAATFGKFLVTFEAIEQANVFVFSIKGADADIFSAANAVLGAVFIQATKLIEIVHKDVPWGCP